MEKAEVDEKNYHFNSLEGRILNNTLVNKTVCMVYDQWLIGTITWYNEKFHEYRVLFADKSKD